MKRFFLGCCLALALTGRAQTDKQNQDKQYQKDVQPAVFALTMVMMHDVVNPPAAARFYTYSTLGAYDLISSLSGGLPRPSAIFHQYKDFVIEIDKKKLDPGFAAVYSILEGGRVFLPSGYMLEKDLAEYEAKCRKRGVPSQKIDYSKEIAKKYVQHVLDFSKGDRYNKLSTMVRYSPKNQDWSWYPTPPGYMDAVEPHWKIIRPMFMDSSQQFKPKPPVPFSKDTTSEFHKLAYEVYK
ncbi:MAG TPA: haloperoxidase, partial [Flavihumibacter sp.]